MYTSFSFKGKDITEFDLFYVPENKDTNIYTPFNTTIHDENLDGHEGGYFYGVSRGPKEFILRCFYHDIEIQDGFTTKINRFFARGTTGKLVFTVHPWMYYIATVTDIDTSTFANYRNGLITIKMKAYVPFAMYDGQGYDPEYERVDDIMNNSFMIPSDAMPSLEFTDVSAQTTIPVYYGGTENAPLKIDIAGDVGRGVTIRNTANGSQCSFAALNGGSSTEYIRCDGATGKTYWVGGTKDGQLAFKYHNSGFIELEAPEELIAATVSGEAESNELTTEDELSGNIAGRYISIDGSIVEITAYDEDTHTITISEALTNDYSGEASILQMNKLEVIPESDMDLSLLRFDYKTMFP